MICDDTPLSYYPQVTQQFKFFFPQDAVRYHNITTLQLEMYEFAKEHVMDDDEVSFLDRESWFEKTKPEKQ